MRAKAKAIAKLLDVTHAPALNNPAVAHCAHIFETFYQANRAQGLSDFMSEVGAYKAFRQAMPPLYGYQNICDFIACANYGTLIGAIKPEDVSKLMYSAQVALTALPPNARTQLPAPQNPPSDPSPSPRFAATPSIHKG